MNLRHGLVIFLTVAAAGCRDNDPKAPNEESIERAPMTIAVTSGGFSSNGAIPAKFSGDGEDLSPPLTFARVPREAKELVLIVDDPDAPGDEPWVHWVVYKIPADGKLPEGVDPSENPLKPNGALQGKNSWGAVGYRGPAPPKGDGVHHYHFKVFALDEPLSVKPGLDKATLRAAMKGHVLARGELIGTYQR